MLGAAYETCWKGIFDNSFTAWRFSVKQSPHVALFQLEASRQLSWSKSLESLEMWYSKLNRNEEVISSKWMDLSAAESETP